VQTSNKIIRFFKEPLVLLLLLGAAIYGGWRFFQSREDQGVEQAKIHINAGQIDGMVAQWEKRWNRPPTREEIDGLVQKYVREEILYRQAVAMGLDKNDPVTRLRTVQKLEFLTNDLADAQQPGDAELEQYFVDNEADYRAPDLITFSQVFFNPDQRKQSTLDDAKAALAGLKGGGEPDPEKLEAGDRFMLQNYFRAVTEAEIRRQMGSGFAESVMKLEPGRWHDPVLSGFGVHLVYVYALQKGDVPPLDAVKDKVLAAWHDEKRKELSEGFLEGLRERYEIVIDEVPDDRFITPAGEGSGADEADDDGAQG
jgi:peptidyl-prolyl cis-trans isomerase C